MASHYEVLGVAVGAPPEAVRRAYHVRARELHPDRSPGSERAMQQVNEAWRVLRDPKRRADYDDVLVAVSAKTTQRNTTSPFGLHEHENVHVVESSDLFTAMVRGLPWFFLAAVLGSIFLFTAYAGSSSDSTPQRSAYDLVGECVDHQAGTGLVAVACALENVGRVDLVVTESTSCPSGTRAREFRADGNWLCLRPSRLAP